MLHGLSEKRLEGYSAIVRAGMYALLAALIFSLMGAAIKQASQELETPMVVFLRNAFGLLALLPWLLKAPGLSLRTQRPGLHILRCVIGLSAMYCFFFAIAHLPLAEAMLLNYATPLYVPLIAWLWLGEIPRRSLFPIVLLGFCGVAVLLQPGAGDSTGWAGMIGLAAGVMAAGAFVAIRRLSSSEPALRIVFYFTSLSLCVSLIPLPWAWQTPSSQALLLMACAGVLASLAQLALTRAYSLAPAAQVAPFNYTVVLFAACWGWWLWAETPDRYSVLGALMIIASSLLALRQK